MYKTLIKKAECMLFNANLAKHFWVEAVIKAVYLISRIPYQL